MHKRVCRCPHEWGAGGRCSLPCSICPVTKPGARLVACEPQHSFYPQVLGLQAWILMPNFVHGCWVELCLPAHQCSYPLSHLPNPWLTHPLLMITVRLYFRLDVLRAQIPPQVFPLKSQFRSQSSEQCLLLGTLTALFSPPHFLDSLSPQVTIALLTCFPKWCIELAIASLKSRCCMFTGGFICKAVYMLSCIVSWGWVYESVHIRVYVCARVHTEFLMGGLLFLSTPYFWSRTSSLNPELTNSELAHQQSLESHLSLSRQPSTGYSCALPHLGAA